MPRLSFVLLALITLISFATAQEIVATKVSVNAQIAPAFQRPGVLLTVGGRPSIVFSPISVNNGVSTDGQRVVTWAPTSPVVQVASSTDPGAATQINTGIGTFRAIVSGKVLAVLNGSGNKSSLAFYSVDTGQRSAVYDLPLSPRFLNLSFDGDRATLYDVFTLQVGVVSLSGEVSPIRTLRGPSVDAAKRAIASKPQPGLPPGAVGGAVILLAHLRSQDGADLFFLAPQSREKGVTLAKFDQSGAEQASVTVRPEQQTALLVQPELVLGDAEKVFVPGRDGFVYSFRRPQ